MASPDVPVDVVRRAQAGERAAFAELYEAYFDAVYAFCWQLTRSAADAADAVQETFVKAVERLHTLREPAMFRGWLYAIARNAALDLLRGRSRVGKLPEDLEAMLAAGSRRSSDPVAVAEAKEVGALVWQAAKSLNPRDYSIFEMTVRHGLSSAEVAEALDIKPSHAYVLVNRLKDTLEDAVAALVMMRAGPGACPELDAVTAGLGADGASRLRQAVGKHVRSCEVCSERRAREASSTALFAGASGGPSGEQ
jgi:RNA polymerase sigma factor (sigma-70 family)